MVKVEPVLDIGVGNMTCVVAMDVHRFALDFVNYHSEFLWHGCVFCVYNGFVFDIFVHYISVGV